MHEAVIHNIKKPQTDSRVADCKEEFGPPLSFTRVGIKRDPDGWSEPTLFVVDPASTLDMIDLFWNIRQFHPQILAISLPWLQDARDFLAEFLRANYRPLRPRAPVIVLTGLELFSNWHINHSWEERGGRHAKFVELPNVM